MYVNMTEAIGIMMRITGIPGHHCYWVLKQAAKSGELPCHELGRTGKPYQILRKYVENFAYSFICKK